MLDYKDMSALPCAVRIAEIFCCCVVVDLSTVCQMNLFSLMLDM